MTIGTYAFSLERAKSIANSHAYMQSRIVFGFTESEKFTTSLERLMAPFRSCMWTSIGMLLIISIVIILLTKNLPSQRRHFIIGGRINRTPILNMINAIIGNVIPNQQMNKFQYFGVFARTLTILWIFFWLIVRNSYQGICFDFV